MMPQQKSAIGAHIVRVGIGAIAVGALLVILYPVGAAVELALALDGTTPGRYDLASHARALLPGSRPLLGLVAVAYTLALAGLAALVVFLLSILGATAQKRFAQWQAECEAPAQAAALGAHPCVPRVLARAARELDEGATSGRDVVDSMTDSERASIEAFLQAFHSAGRITTNTACAVAAGMRSGTFAPGEIGAFALGSFLLGRDQLAFDLVTVFENFKA